MESKAAAGSALGVLLILFSFAWFLFPPRATGAGRVPPAVPPAPSPLLSPAPDEPPAALGGGTVRLLLADGSVAALDLEEYIYGVVAAEMPAAFSPAALEAQAVAGRTYALRRVQAGPHAPGADLCADPTCCQGYDPAPEGRWGDEASALRKKLRTAVAATAGEVLVTADGQLIDAVFHASSAGATAPAQAVWGAAVPYLVSVSTPETAQAVPDLVERVIFSPEELAKRLCPGQVGEILRADWGGVETLAVGGQVFTGVEVRQRLGLRSTRFTVEQTDSGYAFTTQGYGHGVGMSQQGANLLAQGGATYQEILAHYYPGTQVVERG